MLEDGRTMNFAKEAIEALYQIAGITEGSLDRFSKTTAGHLSKCFKNLHHAERYLARDALIRSELTDSAKDVPGGGVPK